MKTAAHEYVTLVEVLELTRPFEEFAAAALLAVALAACQTSGAPAPTPAAVGAVNTSATSAPAAPTAQPVAATAVPPATAVGVPATPAVGMVPEQAIKAALLAQYPGAAIRIQCAEGDFAAAAIAPLGAQHGFDAYLHQQSGAWAIITNGVDISRESLIKLGFPDSFCGMPTAPPTPLPNVPTASSPLVGPEWTLLVTGDLDRNGREDVVAFKPALITPIDPAPGSQPKDVFVAFRELVVVERAADGAPAVRLLMNTSAVLADNQVIAQIPAADRPTSGVLAELRYLDRSFELRLIDDTSALGRPFLTVRYSENSGAYTAEAAGTNQPALTIGALTISPSDLAPAGPESGPPGRLVRAGTTVTLAVDVQGARQVIFFADGLGQSGNIIGSSADLSAGRAQIVWTVPAGVGQQALYAQARDGSGQVAASAQVPISVQQTP
jgi:hypothetical protein